MELPGRRAVVTGGGGGLGEVIAGRMAAKGMHVIVADVDEQAARRVAKAVGGTPVTADLAAGGGADAVAAAVGAELDVLVNCAGGWHPGGRRYPDAAPEEWEWVLALNLRSPMRLTQALRGALSRSPVGAVVSIASSAGRETTAYQAPEYAAAKAGLIRFTTSVADWAERYGVRVSCVVPGWIGLPRAYAEIEELPVDARPELIPPRRIADAVLALVEDPASAGRVVVIE